MNKQFINIMDFGAAGDGNPGDTKIVARAIGVCKKYGGGTIYFPPGKYLVSSLHLVSHLTIHIDAGAEVYFSTDFDGYPPVRTRWEGVECYGFSPLIYGAGLENVTLIGRGVIDGQGRAWWDELYSRRKEGRLLPESGMEKRLAGLNRGYKKAGSGGGGREMQFLRPPLVQFIDCYNVKIDGLTLRNSPFWNTHIVYCDTVSITDVMFNNPPGAPNTDGLDIDSSRNVSVSGCHFDVGDDCLCLKSGMDEDGRRVGRPAENVTISNCIMRNGHGGIVFGSEAAGDIRNITVSGCILAGTERGIRIKSRRGRGGTIEDVRVSNIIMREVLCPLVMNLYYKCGADTGDMSLFSPGPQPVSEKTPSIRNIFLSHITATGVRAAAAFFYGLPENPIENLTLFDVMVEMCREPGNEGGQPAMVHGLPVMAGKGIFYKHVRDLNLIQVKIILPGGKVLYMKDNEGAERDNLETGDCTTIF